MPAPFRDSGTWRGRVPFVGRGPWAGKGPFGYNAGLAFAINATGTQIRAAINDPTAYGETLGPELVTNGGFDTDTVWSKGAGWSISGGAASRGTSAGGSNLTQAGLLTIGRTYRITLDVVAVSLTSYVLAGDAANASFNTTGSKSFTLTCAGSTDFIVQAGSASATLTVDNVSVKLVATGYLLPGLGGARLNASARASVAMQQKSDGGYEYAAHNLASLSEELDNATWLKLGGAITGNSAASPFGATTAELFVEDSAPGRHMVYRGFNTVAGQSITVSVYAKASTRQYVTLLLKNVSGASPRFSATFDLIAGTTTATNSSGTPSGTSSSIQNIGTGYYRISVTMQASGAATNVEIGVSNSATPNYSESIPEYTGNGTGSVLLWGAQLNLGPTALPYAPTTSAAVYAPAVDWLSAQSAYGLRSEAAATNLLLQSANKTSVSWAKEAGATIIAGTHACPVSGVVELLSTTSALGFYQLATGANSTQYTAWMLVRLPPSGNTILFGLTNQDETAIYYAQLNSSGAVVASVSNVGFTGGSHAVAQIGSTGWYLLQVTATSPASGTTNVGHFCRLLLAGSVAIGHSQLETGSRASSPILTLGATATRAVDTVDVVGSGINALAGSVVVDAVLSRATPSGIILVGLSATGSTILYFVDTDYRVYGSGGSFQTIPGAVPLLNVPQRAALAWETGSYSISAQGLLATNAESIGIVNAIRLGDYASGSSNQALGGHFTRIRYGQRRLSNAQLQALTV